MIERREDVNLTLPEAIVRASRVLAGGVKDGLEHAFGPYQEADSLVRTVSDVGGALADALHEVADALRELRQ